MYIYILYIYVFLIDHYILKMISGITNNTCLTFKHLNLTEYNGTDIFYRVDSSCNLLPLNLRSAGGFC